jgi:FkbM family methyltransferase
MDRELVDQSARSQMMHALHRIGRRMLPVRLKAWLRQRGWFGRSDAIVWRLPPPLSEYRMTGPGVFGTYVNQAYESDVVHALAHLIQPGWTVVDVGAHLGFFTLLLAHLAGESGRVFAFEAHPDNARWLRQNITLNEVNARVCVENLALSDGSQAVVRLHAPRFYTSAWSMVRTNPGGRFLEIRAASADQYFAQGPRVDFVKMDIEGGEHLALLGMRELLHNHQPVLMVELHGEEGERAARLLAESRYTLTDMSDRPAHAPTFLSQDSHIIAWPGGNSGSRASRSHPPSGAFPES